MQDVDPRRGIGKQAGARGGPSGIAARPRRLLPVSPTAAAIVCLILMSPHRAHAVIPELIGPLQALWAAVAQLVPILAAAVIGMLGLGVWWARLRHGLAGLRHGRGRVLALALGATLLAALVATGLHLTRRSPAPVVPGPDPMAPAPPREREQVCDWPTFRGNPRRSGGNDDLPGPVQPVAGWTYSDPSVPLSDFSSSPAVVGSRVYFGAASANVFRRSGGVYCLDRHSGRRIWYTPISQQVFSSPAVSHGRVYIGEGLHEDVGSKLHCLDADTGSILWEVRTGSHVESSPTVADGRVVFGAGDDGLFCVDAESGHKVWQIQGYHVDVSPVVVEGIVFAGSGYGRCVFFAADAAAGELLWEKDTGASAWGHPAVASGRVIFATSNVSLGEENERPSGRIHCLDARTGEEVWSRPVPHGISAAAALSGDSAFVSCWDGHLRCLDAKTGELRWDADLRSTLYSSPAVDDRSVYVGTSDGRLVCLERPDGRIRWALSLEQWLDEKQKILASVALADGRLYVGAAANLFVCIGEAPRFATRPEATAPEAD